MHSNGQIFEAMRFVCQYLEYKDYFRLKSTCKAMSQLDPPILSFASYKHATLKWQKVKNTQKHVEIENMVFLDFKCLTVQHFRFLVLHEHVSTLERIITRGSDFDPSIFDQSAIISAVKFNRPRLVELLCRDSRVDPRARNYQCLEVAAARGYFKICEILSRYLDVSVRDNMAIRLASINGHWETVELLLKNPRVDPSCRDNDCLYYACQNGHTKVVELLLNDPRVDASMDDNSAIKVAIRNRFRDIVELLLSEPTVFNGMQSLMTRSQ